MLNLCTSCTAGPFNYNTVSEAQFYQPICHTQNILLWHKEMYFIVVLDKLWRFKPIVYLLSTNDNRLALINYNFNCKRIESALMGDSLSKCKKLRYMRLLGDSVSLQMPLPKLIDLPQMNDRDFKDVHTYLSCCTMNTREEVDVC